MPAQRGAPGGAINTLLEASNDGDVVVSGYITAVEDPKLGRKQRVNGSPWKSSETPAQPGIAPELDDHNDAVLRELGFSEPNLSDLRAREVI